MTSHHHYHHRSLSGEEVSEVSESENLLFGVPANVCSWWLIVSQHPLQWIHTWQSVMELVNWHPIQRIYIHDGQLNQWNVSIMMILNRYWCCLNWVNCNLHLFDTNHNCKLLLLLFLLHTFSGDTNVHLLYELERYYNNIDC